MEYDEAIDDLLQFVKHGTGAVPFDAQRERRRLMVQREDAAFLQEMAGALGVESIQALYDTDDVEIALRQRQVRGERRGRRRVPVGDEADMTQHIAVTEREVARLGELMADEKVRQLHAVGGRVVASFSTLVATEMDLELLLDGQRSLPKEAVYERLVRRVDEFRRTHDHTGTETDFVAFFPLTLFATWLDNGAATAGICALLAPKPEYDAVFQQRRLLFPADATVERSPAAWPSCEPADALANTRTVRLPLVRQLYGETGLRPMATLGCRAAYAAHVTNTEGVEYVTMVMRYIFAATAEEAQLSRQDLSRRLNIFAAGPDGQPKEVAALLHLTQREYDADVTKDVLLSHFLWLYFDRASLQQLAADWTQYGRAPSAALLRQEDVLGVVERAKSAVAEYFALAAKVTNLIAPPLPEDFTGWTLRFPTADSVRPLLDSPEEIFAQPATRVYPVLALDTLLPVYWRQLAQQSEKLLANRQVLLRRAHDNRTALEAELDEGEEEDEDEERMLLKPTYEYAMRVALEKVTQQCADLRTLTVEALKSQSCITAGLTLQFFQFMAAMMRESASRGKKGTTRQQRDDLVRGTWQVMRALKQYRLRRSGRHSFAVTRVPNGPLRGATLF